MPPRHAQHGFSLFELVMVIVLLSIVAVLGSQMLSSGFSAYFTGRDIINADWQGRFALERMNKELRTIRTATAADLDVTLAPAAISFVDIEGNNINYSLAGTSLTRNGIPLADGVNSMTFSYIQPDGITTAALATEVYYVSVALNVTLGGANINLRSTLHPRNF